MRSFPAVTLLPISIQEEPEFSKSNFYGTLRRLQYRLLNSNGTCNVIRGVRIREIGKFKIMNICLWRRCRCCYCCHHKALLIVVAVDFVDCGHAPHPILVLTVPGHVQGLHLRSYHLVSIVSDLVNSICCLIDEMLQHFCFGNKKRNNKMKQKERRDKLIDTHTHTHTEHNVTLDTSENIENLHFGNRSKCGCGHDRCDPQFTMTYCVCCVCVLCMAFNLIELVLQSVANTYASNRARAAAGLHS